MIRAAVVGLGWWGQVLANSIHGKSRKIAVTRGVTRTPERARDFARETGIPVDADFAGLLADRNIDALILATPHSKHADQILAAASAGKHVFVEKPLALTAADAVRAFDASARAGVTLAVGQNRRYLPAVAALKELIAGGRLGKVMHIEAQFSVPSGYRYQRGAWRARSGESPSGGMTGLGVHMTDLMIDILGRPAEVNALSFRQVLEIEMHDTTAMLIRFERGPSAYLGTLTATAPDWRFQVFGARGWSEIRQERILTTATLEDAAVTREFPQTDVEFLELEAFADAVERGDPVVVPRGDAVANIALLEAIGTSAANGRTMAVEIPE